MTCHRAVAPSPPPLPASKIALQEPSARLVAVDTTYIQCGINKGPTRPAYSDVMIVPGTACFPAPRLEKPIGNFNFQPPPLLPAGIQAFPWTHTHIISSCCIATTVAPSCAHSSHRIALRFAFQVAGIEARKLSFLHPLSCLKPLALCSIQLAPVKSSHLSDLLDLSEPGWTVQVHLHTPQTTVDVSTATMTTTILPLAKEAPLPL